VYALCEFVLSDKSGPHIDDTESSGQGKQRSRSIQLVSSIRAVPPKPPRKTASKETVLCSPDPLEGSAAISSSQDLNCFSKPTVETDGKMVFGNRRDSTIENSSEKEGSVEEWVPPVHSIIFALEQESAANEARRSAALDSKCSIDLNKSDRFSRCRFNFDTNKDNVSTNKDNVSPYVVSRSQRLSTAKKTPPQVPAKSFKSDQSRNFQVCFLVA